MDKIVVAYIVLEKNHPVIKLHGVSVLYVPVVEVKDVYAVRNRGYGAHCAENIVDRAVNRTRNSVQLVLGKAVGVRIYYLIDFGDRYA